MVNKVEYIKRHAIQGHAHIVSAIRTSGLLSQISMFVRIKKRIWKSILGQFLCMIGVTNRCYWQDARSSYSDIYSTRVRFWDVLPRRHAALPSMQGWEFGPQYYRPYYNAILYLRHPRLWTEALFSGCPSAAFARSFVLSDLVTTMASTSTLGTVFTRATLW